jgi:hypothetical protein
VTFIAATPRLNPEVRPNLISEFRWLASARFDIKVYRSEWQTVNEWSAKLGWIINAVSS